MLILLLPSVRSNAQWLINSSADLETDLLSTSTSFGVYHNVVLDGFLGININTTGCPATRGGGVQWPITRLWLMAPR